MWGSTNDTQMGRVKKMHNFAAKVNVGGAKKYDHVTPFFNKLGWLRMNEKYFFDICFLVFKIKNKLLPEWLFSLPTVGQIRGDRVNTRNLNALHIPRTHTDTGARAMGVVCPTMWNKLPSDIRECQSISSFKRCLKDFLLKE